MSFDDHERAQWHGRADDFAGSFAHLCAGAVEALLDAAGVSTGTRMLDVGTGTGAVASAGAARGARVWAADAEPSMVAATAARVPAAEVVLATLPHLPYADGEFDAVLANFVLNHVGDPRAAAAELRRVTGTGGRVAVSVWPAPASPSQALWPEVFAAAGVTAVPGTRLPAERDFARTPDGLAGVLASAGLRDVTATTLTWTHRVDPETWWAGPAAGLGAAGATLLAQTPEARSRVRAVYDALTRDRTGPDGRLALDTSAVLAVGHG